MADRQSQYPDVTEPIPYPSAFQNTGEVSAQSQAAFLLTLGEMVSEEPVTAERLDADAGDRDMMLPEEDRAALNMPDTMFELSRHRGARFESGLVAKRFAPDAERAIARATEFHEPSVDRLVEMQVSLAETLMKEPDPEAAAALVAVSMRHPQELVRVAAATSVYDYFPSDPDRELAREILVSGSRSADSEVRDVARTALGRNAPEHPRIDEMMPPSGAADEGEPSHTLLLVHGTFAMDNEWWQPGIGDFHTYLKNDVRGDVYSGADRYDWSGGYSHRARLTAADDLRDWVAARNLEGLDLYAHSHGASAAMLASGDGLTIGKLVMLSCPVHPGRYDPDFSRINEVHSVRVRFDLVILADRGGQRFDDPRIRENVLPIWFKHSASHYPDAWRDHGVPARIGE